MAGAQVEFLLTPFITSEGPLVGGEIKFFIAGTTTPVDVFSDKDLTSNIGNTVVLDPKGIANVFVDGQNFLKIEIREEPGGLLIDMKDGLSYRGGLEDQGLFYLLDGSRPLQGDMDVSGYDLIGCGDVNVSTGKSVNINHGHGYSPTGSDMVIMGDTNATYRVFTIAGSMFIFNSAQELVDLNGTRLLTQVPFDVTGNSTHRGELAMDDNKITGGAEATVYKDFVTLDNTNKIPTSNLPDSVIGGMQFQGLWDANTNTPTLTSGAATDGHYYIVSVAGSTNLDGITDWKIGDWAVGTGTTWGKIDNTDLVSSVFGRVGNVTAQNNDYSASQVNNDSAITGGNVAIALENVNGNASNRVARAGDTMTGPLTLFGTPSGDQAAKFNQIPTNNTSLTNGAGYQTATDVNNIITSTVALNMIDGRNSAPSTTIATFTINAGGIGQSGAGVPGWSMSLTGGLVEVGTRRVMFSGGISSPAGGSAVNIDGFQISTDGATPNSGETGGSVSRGAGALSYVTNNAGSLPVAIGYRRIDDNNIEIAIREGASTLMANLYIQATGSLYGT